MTTTTITQTHTYAADPATVFSHLTDPALLNGWWTSKAESDARPGGAFRYEWNFTPEAPKDDHVQEGTYTTFEQGRALAYPWAAGATTHVRFDLESDGDGGTKLILTHSKVPDNEELVGMLAGGWTFFLENLGRLLSGGPDGRAQMGMILAQAA